MVDTLKVVLTSFGQIKKNLDPAFTYLVFEWESVGAQKDSFPEITPELAALDKIKFEARAYEDTSRNKVGLVLKTSPEAGEIMKAKFLAINFPKDIILYVFDSKINP